MNKTATVQSLLGAISTIPFENYVMVDAKGRSGDLAVSDGTQCVGYIEFSDGEAMWVPIETVDMSTNDKLSFDEDRT